MGNHFNLTFKKVNLKIGIVLIITWIFLISSGCDIMSESPDIIPCIIMDINVISPTTIELSWIKHHLDIEEYIITKENPDSLVATYFFPNNENSFIDDQLVPGITYHYEIFADDNEYSYDSDYINTLQPPSDLWVMVFNGEAIKLNWQDNNQIEDYYYIERKEENETSFTVIDSLPANTTNYFDYNLEHMSKYSYRVNSIIENYYTEYTNIDSTGFHFDGLFVPTDYATIEQAFAAASPAEKIILEPGSYEGGIIFPTKSITLCSRYVLDNDPTHIENTIIDGQHQAIIGIKFPSMPSSYYPQGIVQGLTIQHCNNGALQCLDNTYPTFSNLIIKENITSYSGAIKFINCTNVNISNLLIYDNSSNTNGSAINLYGASIRIYNCTIVNNGDNVINCTYDSRVGVYNTIIYNNTGTAIYVDESCWGCTVFYSDIEGGEDNIQNLCSVDTWWFHSINEDPLFADADNYNFHLLPESPCIDTGESLEIYLDVDGSRNDMGAYGGPNGDW